MCLSPGSSMVEQPPVDLCFGMDQPGVARAESGRLLVRLRPRGLLFFLEEKRLQLFELFYRFVNKLRYEYVICFFVLKQYLELVRLVEQASWI